MSGRSPFAADVLASVASAHYHRFPPSDDPCDGSTAPAMRRGRPRGQAVQLYYLAMKGMFLCGLVRSYVVYDPLRKHWLGMAVLYTLGIAFLSYVFLFGPGVQLEPRPWEFVILGTLGWSKDRFRQVWLVETLVLSALYFKLLDRFDEGWIFWTLLMLVPLFVIF